MRDGARYYRSRVVCYRQKSLIISLQKAELVQIQKVKFVQILVSGSYAVEVIPAVQAFDVEIGAYYHVAGLTYVINF